MVCPKCGSDAGTAKFCPECGANVLDGTSAAQPTIPTIVINNVNANANANTNVNQNTVGTAGTGISAKSKMVTLILAIVLGAIGAHRFYVGKTGSGILYLFTMGLFGFGWIYDIIKIASGTFRDGLGLPIVR